MARKPRPLTDMQIACLMAAEDTLFGDVKLADGIYARSVRGLRVRGLVDGDKPHVYLTEAGKAALEGLSHG